MRRWRPPLQDSALSCLRTCWLLLACVSVAPFSAAQAQAEVEEGARALAAGEIEHARTLLHQAARTAPRDARVLALLARLYTQTTPPDRARAAAYVRRGLYHHPDSPDLLKVRLQLALSDTAAARFERMEALRSLSRRLLLLRPRDGEALLGCGLGGYDDVAWRLGQGAFTPGARAITRRYRHAAACLDTLLVDEPHHAVARRTRIRLALLLEYYPEAESLARAWTAADPSDVDAWRWLGLSRWLDDRPGAASAFDTAFARAPAAEKVRWRSPAPLLAPGEAVPDTTGFWQIRDPLLTTPQNERWTAHLARLALADLFFDEGSGDGTRTLRGNWILRYGLPENVTDALAGYGMFVSSEDGRLVSWEYGDFRMVFQDWFMSGDFNFFSPSAKYFSGRDTPNDYTLIARALQRSMPERLVLTGVQPFGTVAVYTFPATDSADVVIAALPDAPGAVEAFVVSREKVTRATPLVTSTIHALHYFRLAPGRYRVQAEQTTRAGMALLQDSLVVAARADGLALSSLVPARLVEEGGLQPGAFARKGFSITPAVDARFRVGAALYLYVEAAGLASGEAFEVEVEAANAGRRTLFSRPATRVGVAFSDKARSSTEARYYVLDTTRLSKGPVRVQLRIRDSQGRTAETSTSIVLE